MFEIIIFRYEVEILWIQNFILIVCETNILLKAEIIWIKNKKKQKKLLLILNKILIFFEEDNTKWMKYDKIMMIKYLSFILFWAKYHFQLIVNMIVLIINENW